VSVTDPPGQSDVEPEAVTTGVGGFGLMVTLTGCDVARHPFASVTVTAYEPAAAVVIDCVLSPSDHEYV
jgi:hypothetical protein